MTLSELLAEKFRADLRFRGEAYLKSERVEITRVTPNDVYVVVHDGVDYQTQLSRRDEKIQLFCTCSAGASGPVYCKHLWAAILSVDEGGFLTGSVRNGVVPPFAWEEPSFEFEDDDWDDEPAYSTSVPRVSATQSPPKKPSRKVEVKLKPWEQNLKSVREKMQQDGTTTANRSREREIVYEIDPGQSREHGVLVVQTSQRQRRVNGQWGKLKPLKLKNGRLDEIESSEDRKLLAYLSGGMPERSNWYAQQAEAQQTSFRYRVPYELCTLILPLMCATGRVRYLDQNPDQADSLNWVDAEPWELCLRVLDRKSDEDPWKLDVRLVRGEEELPPREAQLLLPGGLAFIGNQISPLRDFDSFAWIELMREQRRQVGGDFAQGETTLRMGLLPDPLRSTNLRSRRVIRCGGWQSADTASAR